MPFIKIKNFNMYYEIHGEGEPLLLIHGLGSSSQDWEFQISKFSKFYRVIAIDLRGHGKSDKLTATYSIRNFADDCALLINELNFDSLNVMGISMGGAVGFELAINYPSLINSLIIINMGVKIRVKTLSEKFTFFTRVFIVSIMGMKKMGEFLAPKLFPSPEQENLKNLVISRWAKNDKKSYLISLKSLKNWSVEEKLEKIQCKTLIVASDGDYSSVESKKEYLQKIPNGQIVIIKNSHHAVPMEKPEHFNDIILNFLKHI